jgi:PAS domain S-box-containing protein
MTSRESLQVDLNEPLPLTEEVSFSQDSALPDDFDVVELSHELRADLLDLEAWGQILETFGRTMGVAVALTDCENHLLGTCRNTQPVWDLVRDATRGRSPGCPFCLTQRLPCTAVADAVRTGEVVTVSDEVGLMHVAVPLSLGNQCLGAIIAGQVFDRFPEQLSLRRAAKQFGVSAQQLWELAGKQRPVSRAALQASGDLLLPLGKAFLRQRYGAIVERKLAETNRWFRLLVEGVKDYALFTTDLTGRVTSWNGGAERLLGYANAEIVGQEFRCIFTSEDIRNGTPENQLQEASLAGRAEDQGWRVRQNRTQFWAEVIITAEAGPLPGFAIILQDVTERRRAATELENTRQERTRMQEKFLSHVSHELRTPLTAIYFFTTNLLDGVLGDVTPEQREHLEFMLHNVKQLKNMVSDLLDVTRLETRKLTVEPQQASVSRLIAEVLGTCHANAAAKNISLRADVSPSLPSAWADPARVRQILINLIDNAIKFTPRDGTVTVQGRVCAEDSSFLCLSVVDTGCGISPEDCRIVFDRLAQVKNAGEASRDGLGLGLFISRELVSQQGGRIWVESRLGHGSAFHFTLPVFSLAKLCIPVLTPTNLEAGYLSLIAVDVATVDETSLTEILSGIRKVLGRCFLAGRDVLLPQMHATEAAESFFIVACADQGGAAAITGRIRGELQDFDTGSNLTSTISVTTLRLPAERQSWQKEIADVTARIGRLVEAHVHAKEKV